jgi:hypothetical protein
MKMRLLTRWAVSILFSIICVNGAVAAISYTYLGNGSGAADSAVGHGKLVLSDNGSTIHCVFNAASAPPADSLLVLYIDSVANGFSSTSAFNDKGNIMKAAISGLKMYGTSRSTATFASGFGADYALVLKPGDVNYNALFTLNTDGSLEQYTGSLGYTGDSQNSSVYFDWSSIGIGSGTPRTFRFESTYINPSTSTGRTLESFENFAGDSLAGWNSVTFANYDTYPISPVPEPVNVALGIFGSGFLVVSGVRYWRRVRC